MRPVNPAMPAILLDLETIGGVLLVLERIIVPALTLRASQNDHHAIFFLRHFAFGTPHSPLGTRGIRHEENGHTVRSPREYSTRLPPCKRRRAAGQKAMSEEASAKSVAGTRERLRCRGSRQGG